MFHRRNRQDRHHTVVPARMICLSFLLVIVVGALLLMLPISSKSGVSPAPIDALFTATSATCVTGLIVFDTFTQWTIFGQSVILMLIQLGGLGLVSFTTFFTLSLRGKLGLREMRLAGEQMNFGSINGVQSLLNIIIKVTFGCEAVGALLLMIRMIPMFGVARGVYTSVFLAVSAYCNAGFDVLGPIGPTGSLSVFSGDWLVLGVLGILIIIGGLGFIVFNDIFTSRLRGERQHRLMLHSKVVLMITGGLILLGTVGFLILEHNHLLAGKPFGSQVIDSWFSAVTPRTAGYAVVNYGSAQSLTKLLTCMLMFIGASPGGTGGGVKTSTVFVLLMTVYSVMVGYNDTVILRKRVERSTVYKAIALVFFSILLLSIAFIILVICEQGQHEIDLLFEVVSAFSTTGLSSANTASLGTVSKAVLIALMYIGRVGPISFILTLSTHYGTKDRDTTLPEGKIMVG